MRKSWILDDLKNGNVVIIVPDLLISELVNVFIKEKRLPIKVTQELISSYFNLPIINKEPTSGVFLRLPDICQEYDLTAYDALYVATALEEGCQLISDDFKGHGKITDGTIVMLENYKSKTKK